MKQIGLAVNKDHDVFPSPCTVAGHSFLANGGSRELLTISPHIAAHSLSQPRTPRLGKFLFNHGITGERHALRSQIIVKIGRENAWGWHYCWEFVSGWWSIDTLRGSALPLGTDEKLTQTVRRWRAPWSN